MMMTIFETQKRAPLAPLPLRRPKSRVAKNHGVASWNKRKASVLCERGGDEDKVLTEFQ